LKDLNLDYVDLYLIHWPGVDQVDKNPTSESAKKIRRSTWKALEEIYKSGQAKAIGVSNYTVKHLMEFEDPGIEIFPMVNQVELHPMLTQEKLREYCEGKGIYVQGYSSLGKGKLVEEKDVIEMGKKYKKSASQVLLRWSIENKVGVIPKSENEKRMKENSELFDFELSDEDREVLNKKNKNWHCTWNPDNVV